MEEEQGGSLEIAGASNCGNFVAGHQFTLKRHLDADGPYLLTRVDHDARLDIAYRGGQASAFTYENRFACVPIVLPYRPQRVTRKPVIAGAQTATVVGPRGEEIFCDKYGRVKVQFHWDREGKKDADSSCWVRVTGVWAGRRRGTTHIPLVGDEVVVAFLEGDPDRPIIVGSVHNAAMMPSLDLPANKTKSVIRDNGINEITMEEKKDRKSVV
jgi:type VI secretion system secreted protein VgrG